MTFDCRSAAAPAFGSAPRGGLLEWDPFVARALSPTADVLLSDRAMGAIPPLGHPRPPKRRRPPRVSPGGLPRALRAKIRLGKALHVEPAIDAHRSARARIAAAWGRMAARSLDCLEQLGFGICWFAGPGTTWVGLLVGRPKVAGDSSVAGGHAAVKKQNAVFRPINCTSLGIWPVVRGYMHFPALHWAGVGGAHEGAPAGTPRSRRSRTPRRSRR